MSDISIIIIIFILHPSEQLVLGSIYKNQLFTGCKIF